MNNELIPRKEFVEMAIRVHAERYEDDGNSIISKTQKKFDKKITGRMKPHYEELKKGIMYDSPAPGWLTQLVFRMRDVFGVIIKRYSIDNKKGIYKIPDDEGEIEEHNREDKKRTLNRDSRYMNTILMTKNLEKNTQRKLTEEI